MPGMESSVTGLGFPLGGPFFHCTQPLDQLPSLGTARHHPPPCPLGKLPQMSAGARHPPCGHCPSDVPRPALAPSRVGGPTPANTEQIVGQIKSVRRSLVETGAESGWQRGRTDGVAGGLRRLPSRPGGETAGGQGAGPAWVLEVQRKENARPKSSFLQVSG